MWNRRTFIAVSLGLVSGFATAAVTTTVVDIPSKGATQRFLHVRPDVPIATIVHLPGGDGTYGFTADGTSTSVPGTCDPVYRNRQAYADHGLAAAYVDANSMGSVRDFDDVLAVIRYVRAQDNVPVWLMGASASTAPAAYIAAHLPGDIPLGVIIFSPVPIPATQPRLIDSPTQVVYHVLDTSVSPASLFNALIAAPVREIVGLSGGSNSGCGYHLFNGVDAKFVATTTGFIDRNNGSLAIAPPHNYQGLWWAAGGAESFWGINFVHQADQVFATWYTYDTTGKVWWLSMLAAKTAGSTYSGPIFVDAGPPFNNYVGKGVPTQVGTGTLTFTDADNGSFAYTVDTTTPATTQTKTITRYDLGTGPQVTCAYSAAAIDLAAATNYQDLWWVAGAAEDGWGVNFAHQGDSVFATWYTYEPGGAPLWLSALATRVGTSNAYTGPLSRTSGSRFDAFDTTKVTSQQVGTATITFADGNHASFGYSTTGAGGLPVANQTKQVTRYPLASGGTLCH